MIKAGDDDDVNHDNTAAGMETQQKAVMCGDVVDGGGRDDSCTYPSTSLWALLSPL